MISRKVLNELLQDPFGPYLDEHVLDKEASLQKSDCKLVLYSFILEHNGKITGLDESERPLQSGEDHRKFRFRGILRLANPNWLSEFGLKTVEAELNLRASERAMREGERRGDRLTLGSLYRSGLLKRSKSAWNNETEDETRLNILIQGEKGLPAVFMQSSRAPTGLLWSSKDQERQYEIATMHVASYSQSENFFWRWRLIALMKEIVKTSPPTPLHKRTPEWYVKMYLDRFAYPKGDIHQRLIYDSGDPDVDEDGKTRIPRQLLTVHKSEVLGLFASQAEWFVTNDAVKREKLLDFRSWDAFWQMVRKERRRAARSGVLWGWPVGEEPDGALSSGESEEEGEETDELDELVKRNPVTGKSGKVVRRKLELARKRRAGLQRVESSSSESGSEEAETVLAYVGEFSEESEDAASDSDEDVDCRIPWMVPRELQRAPGVPDADGRWRCPVRGCGYLADLRQDGGLGRRWLDVLHDGGVFGGFTQLVERHYASHLAELGLEVKVARSGKRRVEWADAGGQDGPAIPAQGSLRGSSLAPVVYVYDAE